MAQLGSAPTVSSTAVTIFEASEFFERQGRLLIGHLLVLQRAYGHPVFAVRGGIVDGADDTQPQNSGNKPMPVGKPNNFVLIKHDDGTYAGYYHLRTGKNKVVPGQMVAAGVQIGEIGNAGGSSEPHLHFGYTTVDPTGHGTITPAIFSGLKTKANAAVTAVPATGQYIA